MAIFCLSSSFCVGRSFILDLVWERLSRSLWLLLDFDWSFENHIFRLNSDFFNEMYARNAVGMGAEVILY